MSGELRPVVDRHRQQAQGAIDYFNWRCVNPEGGPFTVRTLVQVVEELRVAAPADAYVNMSGDVLYAQWQRSVS